MTYEGVYRTGRDRDMEVRISEFMEGGITRGNSRENFETEDGHAWDNALIYERGFKTENRSFKVQLSHFTYQHRSSEHSVLRTPHAGR